MATFGLLGKDISYSYSKPYFENYFGAKNLKHRYLNFDVQSIEEIERILQENPDLKGMNVTIPYKEKVLPYLYKINKEAKLIGAVNTIKISKNGNLIGHNTDHYGFAKSLGEHLPIANKKALILGTGGASKAIAYVLSSLNYEYKCVTREKKENFLTYADLDKETVSNYKLIINCTPLGTSPNINAFPKLNYAGIGSDHLLFDLIYNPRLTLFLKKGKDQGARIVNGLSMLEYQAKKSWKIWNS